MSTADGQKRHSAAVKTSSGVFAVQEFSMGVKCRVQNTTRDIVLVQQTTKRDKGPTLECGT